MYWFFIYVGGQPDGPMRKLQIYCWTAVNRNARSTLLTKRQVFIYIVRYHTFKFHESLFYQCVPYMYYLVNSYMILKTSANVLSTTDLVNLASVREDRVTFRFLDDHATDLICSYLCTYMYMECLSHFQFPNLCFCSKIHIFKNI